MQEINKTVSQTPTKRVFSPLLHIADSGGHVNDTYTAEHGGGGRIMTL
jgi:hypothetical protein